MLRLGERGPRQSLGRRLYWTGIARRSVHTRCPVPVVMFTAHHEDAAEAELGESGRAVTAQFAAVVRKPFELDELITAIADAAGHSRSFDRSRVADAARTNALVAALEAKGATGVHPWRMREWVLFRDRKGRLVQLFWWQARGVYQLGRYLETGQMMMVGQFVDRDAAIEVALP